MFLEAIASARDGDVLVIDNGGRVDEGCIGDLVVGEAHMSGLAATICWGAHRDTGAILAMGAKVWSLGTCPNGPLELRTRVATALEAANVGKVTVTQQDYVFADDDGVIVVAAVDLERIVETAREIAAREGAQAERLLKGELLRTQLDLKGYVEKRQSDPVLHVPRTPQDVWRSDRNIASHSCGTFATRTLARSGRYTMPRN